MTAASPSKRRSSGRPAAREGAVGREMLIEKTCELLRELPPQKVTREAAARHANVHPSLIKYYFRDRDSLIAAAVEKMMSQVGIATETAAARAGAAPVDILSARLKALIDMEVENPSLHRIVVDELMNSDRPAYAEFVDGMTSRALAAYTAIVDKGVESGDLRQVDPAFLYIAIIGMAEFFVAGEAILRTAKGEAGKSDLLRTDYHAFVLDLILNGLRPRPDSVEEAP
jgi:TetR/AcrR family transcriptional regulator